MESENNRGRPTKYKEDYNELVYKLCLLGATDEEMANILNIATSTLYEWKKEYPKFSESITKGKIIADAEIAESLFNRAKGYEFKEVKVESSTGLNGDDLFNAIANENDSEITSLVEEYGIGKVVTTKKHIPADVAAAFIWLKNRRPKEWKDKKEVDSNVNNSTVVINKGVELPDD